MVFNFFTNKTIVTKPIFGQPYLTAYGYDDKHEELFHTKYKNKNVNVASVAQTVQITTGVMEHFADYQALCNIFRTTNLDLLKLLANEKSNIESILKFIYQHHGRWSLICNLNIICQEATVQHHLKSKFITRPIQKLFLGHNVILCIPLTHQISNIDEMKHHIQSLLERKSDRNFPDYFLSNVAILIDYKEVLKMPTSEILNELSNYPFPDGIISLLVELPEIEKNDFFKSNLTSEGLVISIILKLKKLMYLMDVKFAFVRDHKIGRTILLDDGKKKAAEAIITDVEKLKTNTESSAFPSADIIALYNHCCFYEKQYFTALYYGNELPPIYSSLERHLEIAYIFLTDLPFKKTGSIWLIKINDDNANELRQKYLIDKMSILFTPKTKFLIDGFINENIVHVLSEETKWENSTEPVLSLNERTEVLFGMCTPTKIKKETIRNGNVFLDFCKCKIDAEPKAWVCEKCKLLLRIVDEKLVYCECGGRKTADLVKKCFKCKPVQEENKVEKKTLNILFIGQSGAGKSMLINSIYNYLTYNFEEVAKADEVNCILPCQFQLQKPNFEKVVFRAGPQDDNEHFNDSGQSVTQHPKVYKFDTDKYDCKIIDTPGLGDTRGKKQDAYNLNLIKNAIIDNQELHAICFVMPSNTSETKTNFKDDFRDLLLLFPKTALKNIYFFFTCAYSSFFAIGNTRKPLEEFIANFKATNNAEIPFGIENVCCVDSEAFMYFIATKQGHKYQNRGLESFGISWDISKQSIKMFLTSLENVEPIKSDDILMTYELEQIGIMLQKEKSPALEKLIPHILTTISQISMTSKFNLAKKPISEPMDDSQKLDLFRAIELCEKHIIDPNLKQLIIKLLKEYGPTAEVIEGRGLKSNNHKSRVDKVLEDVSKPIPPERFHSQWPNREQLKNIVEKLGEEWENGRIFKNQIENVVNVQIAANQKLELIDKKKLKESLNILMMYVSIELEKDISDLLKACFFTENKVFVSQNESQKAESGTKLMETLPLTPLTVDNKNVFAFPKHFTVENQNINAVGIDLGTSRCCVAVNRRNGIETIPLDNNGDRLLPSYVGYDEPHTKCGQIVIDRIRYYSKATVFDSKRMIGKSMVVIDKIWSFKVIHENNQPIIKLDTERGEIQQTATEVAAVLLKYMKVKTEAFQGRKLTEVVITVPAAFNLSQEKATTEAAIMAGWESITLLPEPVAASFAYFIDRPIPNNSNLLLFDLGGGTFDICVFKIIDDKIQIVSKNGDSKLGGRDFDNLLMDYFSNKLALNYEVTNLGDRKYKLLMECQKIKHNLSVRNDDKLDVEEINPTKEGLIKINQQNFNDLAEDLLNKIKNTILAALYSSRYTADQIDKVLQVGGGCRMPMIKQLLLEIFPNAEHCCEEHPDEVVAIGAAYYAYNIFSTN